MPAPIDLLFADEHLLLLNKPAGLLSVPGKGEDKQDCLSRRVQDQFPDALVVHRLDMATSGLLLMARGTDTQKRLNTAFSERAVHKRYCAIVSGDCRAGGADWQTIDLPILVDWPNRPLRKIDPLNGKPSVTRWRCLGYARHSDSSRLELDPLTGRSHQLRVHLQALGHPILGDPWYAPPPVAGASARLLLHASHLTFSHPHTGETLAFHCPDPFGSDWP
jgi:tRNA pseudouridine32 synthase/23S rRNA pseudouridine746 synthase